MAVARENEAAQVVQLQYNAAAVFQMLFAAVGGQRVCVGLQQAAKIGLVAVIAGQGGFVPQQRGQREKHDAEMAAEQAWQVAGGAAEIAKQ